MQVVELERHVGIGRFFAEAGGTDEFPALGDGCKMMIALRDVAAVGLDAAERREALRFYSEHFAVPEE